MTTSAETGVEDLGKELDGVTTDQPNLSPTPAIDTGTTGDTETTNGSGPMNPRDGYPSPHTEEPPQQPKPPQQK